MIPDYLARSAEAIRSVDIGEIANAILILSEVKLNGGTVWVVGNGGSSSTAEHFAGDLVKVAGLRAVALPSLTPTVLAAGNDEGWNKMFASPILTFRKAYDVLVAISCSGESPNVIQAAEMFPHECLIVLTGNKFDSCLASLDADAKIFVRDPDIRVQEDAHLAVCHVIAGEVGR
jgi:D-sedoheptulose 7-phosphate isomerase